MDLYIQEILANGALLLMIGLFTGSLFFFITALKEFKEDRPEGYLYLTFAVFFLVGHLYALLNQPENSYIGRQIGTMDIWTWAVMIATPALICILCLAGLVSAIVHSIKLGLYKAFFGLTLLCFVYMVGAFWPIDIKALITLLWGGLWFHLELGDDSHVS